MRRTAADNPAWQRLIELQREAAAHAASMPVASSEQPSLEDLIDRARRAYERTIVVAKFASRCVGCHRGIQVGAAIAWRKGLVGVFCLACWKGAPST